MMKKEIANKIIDWNQYYIDNKNEEMSWYNCRLDNDIKAELENREITTGTFLDLGTGPGTQAKQLSEMGFKVTGTDVSEKAVEKAELITDKVNYLQDNILETKLDLSFDYIMDRGCFHVFKPDQRPLFAENVSKLLKPGGLYFLKCFSYKQEGSHGPQRIHPNDIYKTFENYFKILLIKDSVFDGERSSFPKALFVVMQK